MEFDNCTFDGDPKIESIDMSSTDIKSMKIINFRKMVFGYDYTDTVQTVIVISIYFATQDLTRYFSIVDDILIETTKRTFDLFHGNFNSDEAVVLNIRVKSLQELSLMLAKTSKIQTVSFRSQ